MFVAKNCLASKGRRWIGPAVGSLVTFLMALAAALPACAAKVQDNGQLSVLRAQAFPMEDVKSYSFHSKLMGRSYDINVSIPANYGKHPNKKYPVLLLTDGHLTFEIAHGIWRVLADQIDQPILISIGAPLLEGLDRETWRRVYEFRRAYEFSPPNWAMNDPFGQMLAKGCKEDPNADPSKCVGGAPAFFAFMTSELLPQLSKDYRIDSDDLGLYGHSAGGFFASWVMLQGDSRFKRFIIGSPAMAYGDGEIFELEKTYAETHKDLPVRVYMGAGTLELTDPFLEGIGKIVSGYSHFGATLNGRKYPSFRLFSEMHQNLGHFDGAAVILARGLRLLYPKGDETP